MSCTLCLSANMQAVSSSTFSFLFLLFNGNTLLGKVNKRAHPTAAGKKHPQNGKPLP